MQVRAPAAPPDHDHGGRDCRDDQRDDANLSNGRCGSLIGSALNAELALDAATSASRISFLYWPDHRTFGSPVRYRAPAGAAARRLGEPWPRCAAAAVRATAGREACIRWGAGRRIC
jgi:hypothetical protein